VAVPGLLWLARRTRGHHGKVLGASIALQLAMMTISHYGLLITASHWHIVRTVDFDFIMSRDVIGYQLYVVVGVLAAVHFGEVQRVVERHWRSMLWVAVAAFAALEGLYVIGIETHNTPGHASDLYQPAVVIWCLAAIGGLTAAGWAWSQRAARRPAPNRFDRVVRWASDASGGYYLAHVLVLEIIYSIVNRAGLVAPTNWGIGSVVIFFGTMLVTGLLVSLLWRTPLRWILTGPDRAAERAAFALYPGLGDVAPRPAAEVAGARPTAPTTASAISR
jgi:surface polysaccharide O-acyltransferase-like enzyme